MESTEIVEVDWLFVEEEIGEALEGLQRDAQGVVPAVQLRGGGDGEREKAVEEVDGDSGAQLALSLVERLHVEIELAKPLCGGLGALIDLLGEGLLDLRELVEGGVEQRDFGGIELRGGGGMGGAGVAVEIGLEGGARGVGGSLAEDLVDEIEEAFEVVEEERGLVGVVGEELAADHLHGEGGEGVAEGDVGYAGGGRGGRGGRDRRGTVAGGSDSRKVVGQVDHGLGKRVEIRCGGHAILHNAEPVAVQNHEDGTVFLVGVVVSSIVSEVVVRILGRILKRILGIGVRHFFIHLLLSRIILLFLPIIHCFYVRYLFPIFRFFFFYFFYFFYYSFFHLSSSHLRQILQYRLILTSIILQHHFLSTLRLHYFLHQNRLKHIFIDRRLPSSE